MNSDLQIGFRFGNWRAYPLRNLLIGPGGEVHIEPRVMQVLEQLAASAGEVVERDRLLDTLWGGRAMSDEPLTRCIAALRRVLDDTAKDPRYIQTIPKRGYRFVCEVEALTTATETKDTNHRFLSRNRRRFTVAGVALVAALVVVGSWRYFAADPPDISVQGAIEGDTAPKSVAVLAFANLGPDAGSEYLADGLADELANRLTKVRGLRVAARTSSFAFKDRNADITDIARQLRVAYVVTGSVRQSQDHLRISAQLTDAKNGFHVWSDTWDRNFTDVFDIQDEIARAVIGALRVELLNEIHAAPRADPEAYALYLKSREAYFAKVEPGVDERLPNLEDARALVTHALAVDPDYAPAWSQLAWIDFQRGQWTKGNPDEIFASAEAAARRALSLDPENASALSVLGSINDLAHWDSLAAAEWYSRALAAAPDHTGIQLSVRTLFTRHGASEGWLPSADAALERDPLNVGRIINLALHYWNAGDHDAARENLEAARRVNADAGRIRVFEALFAYLEGDFDAAARLAADVHPVIRLCAMHSMGRTERARDILREIEASGPPDAMSLAQANACLGDEDAAFGWLQRAYEQRHPLLRSIRTSHLLVELHGDDRWNELVEKAGVSDEHLPGMRSFFAADAGVRSLPATADQ